MRAWTRLRAVVTDRPSGARGTDGDGADRSWSDYVQDLHAAHAGITEQVLQRARYDGVNPYDWLVERLPREGRVLDLAGGNGALTVRLPPAVTATILDTSPAELADAREREIRRLARADAAALPLADASIDAVACSMALMLVPLRPTLAEVRRVLKPGGLLVATLPATRPLTAGDAYRYGRLLFTLRRTRLSYPNDGKLGNLEKVLAGAGLRLTDDQRCRFLFHIETRGVGRMLFNSLYLPDLPPHRLASARRVAEGWAGADLGIPIRRLTAVAA